MFGGFCYCGGGDFLYNDTWVLTNANGMGGTPAWTLIATSPGSDIEPEPRATHTAVYDPGSNVMTVFGGIVTPSGQLQTNDVFLLSDANGQ